MAQGLSEAEIFPISFEKGFVRAMTRSLTWALEKGQVNGALASPGTILLLGDI